MMQGIVAYDYDKTVNKVKKEHKRKVSQLQALEQELGLYFDEEEAMQIAKQTMKEINPNTTVVEQISVEKIVAKARQEHRRKVSQFQAIKSDIGQYFADEEESAKLAAEVMKEFNPNDRSGKASQITVDSMVERAMKEHSRRRSQFDAIQSSLGLIYDKEDVNAITKDVMKRVFAQKQLNHTDGQMERLEQMEQSHLSKMRDRVELLERELEVRNDQLRELRQKVTDLEDSKAKLAENANLCLNQMRGYLLQYQQTVFRQ